MANNYPEIFHLGMPKTGTTSIQHYLKQDKRINLIRNYYFNSPKWWLEDYKYCASDRINIASDENQVLQSANFGKFINTLSRISRVNPDAKIVLTVREQRSLLLSRYKYSIPYFTGFNAEMSTWLVSPQGMDYVSCCMYATMYRTICAFFKPENVHLLFFEHLREDPLKFYDDLYSIIGLERDSNISVDVKRNTSLTDYQIAYIKSLNKYKIFRKHNKIAIKEAAVYRRLALKFAKDKSTSKFRWGNGKLYEGMEKDFANENRALIELGLISEEELRSFNYLV